MDFSDPKVMLAAAALGGFGIFYLYRRGGSSSDSGDGYAPSLISYVSPGDKDAVFSDSGTTNAPSTTTSGDLKDATISGNETNLSVLNTDSLLTNVSALVNSQVSKLPFKTDYGFTSNVTGAISLEKAGAPSFTFTSSFAPKDATNAAAQIRSLTTRVAGVTRQRDIALRQARTARTQLAEVKKVKP